MPVATTNIRAIVNLLISVANSDRAAQVALEKHNKAALMGCWPAKRDFE
jgi:hypothetical protein